MPYSDKYSDLYDPAFPQSQLDIRTELLLGGAWTDISSKTYQRAGYVITRGHPDESSQVQPQTATLQVDNRGGQFSPRNPYGQYYGFLGRNTPFRLSLPQGSSYLRMEDDTTSYASCPPAAGIRLTGSLDIRIDVQPSGYGDAMLASMWQAGTGIDQRCWYLRLTRFGQLSFSYTTTGGAASIVHASSGTAVPAPLGRICYRVTLDAATGDITFYSAAGGAIDSGPWTQLGAVVAGSGAVTPFASATAPLVLGYSAGIAYDDTGLTGINGYQIPVGVTGAVRDFELRSGIGGSIVARAQAASLVAGTTTWRDPAANVWSLSGTAEISDRRYRIHGEVPSWPQQWDNTGQDVYVPITPSGLLRRLTAGNAPLASPMRRAWLKQAAAFFPVAYWPCEDGAGATQLASGLPAGTPMGFSGALGLASSTAFACSGSLPVLNGAVLTGYVPAGVSWHVNVVRFLLQIPSGGEANGAVIASVYTTGTAARMDLVYASAGAGSLTFNAYTTSGASLWSLTGMDYSGTGVNGPAAMLELYLSATGGGTTVQGNVNAIVAGTSVSGGLATTVSGTLGAVTRIVVNPGGHLTQTAIGHIAVQAGYDFGVGTMYQPLQAWNGEAAGTRFLRLCYEEGIACRIYGHPELTAAMGAQSIQTLPGLLQECEDADRGLVYEPRACLGLAYRTRESMLNQVALLALDYAQAQLSPPIEPTDDDAYTVNDVTVTRSSSSGTGSSARQYLASGAMSVQPPASGVGEYASSFSANLWLDPQAAQAAGWILHTGTVDEPRYPSLTVDLTRSALAGLYDAAQEPDIGDRITVANTPVWLPPDGASQVMRGLTESLNAYEFTCSFAGAPESPYRTGVYDDAVYGRYDTDGSVLASNISATATTFLVTTVSAGSPLWTTDPADFPFDIEVSPAGVSGERMTVTGITGSSSPQTFTVTRSVNGVARGWLPGADIRLFQPAVYA